MSSIKKSIVKILLIRRLRKKVKRKKRACQIRTLFFNRIERGDSYLVSELREDPEYHHKYFRMTKETFDELLELVSPLLTLGRRHFRPISKMEKLAVTLRYLATGQSQSDLALSFRISVSAIGKLLRETTQALCEVLGATYLPVPTEASWREKSKEFMAKWDFPNCCGAIDGKHVRVQAYNQSGSMNFNYKGFFSTVLLAVVDANYRFVLVDIGGNGSQSDGGVLARSAIGKAMETNALHLPNDSSVGDLMLPSVIIGDDAFPLRKYLLKPYPGRGLVEERRIFNYRLSRARNVVENAFGILAARWRIFHKAIIADPQLVKLIIRACVLLHNFLISKKDSCGITGDNVVENELVPGNWRAEPCVRNQGSNNYGATASEVRDIFMRYFNNEGAVSWQYKMIR